MKFYKNKQKKFPFEYCQGKLQFAPKNFSLPIYLVLIVLKFHISISNLRLENIEYRKIA
jgi:hypothetical protein